MCIGCPAGFKYLSTFNGGCYKVVTDSKTWDDAGANCRQLKSDAHLVVISDEAEHSGIVEYIKSMSSLYQFSRVLYITQDWPRFSMTIS